MSTPKGLSLKERRFVDAYLGSCSGNATAAMKAAGYAKNTAEKQAARMLGKVGIKAAIDARQAKAEAKGIAAADERDEIFTTILRDEQLDPTVRLAAGKELNKCSGRHSIKHVMDVTEKLSDIIAASRGPA